MIIIISPSKTLDFSRPAEGKYTNAEFIEEALDLIQYLRKFKMIEIAKLMHISERLAVLNHQRYLDFKLPFTLANSRQALYSFKGDVYEGLAVENFSLEDVHYSHEHLRIISGLYGLLKPLDLIQPYRLEMGTKLVNKLGQNLYKFWGDKITMKLNELTKISGSNILVNLASIEYFKVINLKILQPSLITPIFKERKNGSDKVVGLFAKKARGWMAAYIIKNRIRTVDGLKQFNEFGYSFDQSVSNEQELVFIRQSG